MSNSTPRRSLKIGFTMIGLIIIALIGMSTITHIEAQSIPSPTLEAPVLTVSYSEYGPPSGGYSAPSDGTCVYLVSQNYSAVVKQIDNYGAYSTQLFEGEGCFPSNVFGEPSITVGNVPEFMSILSPTGFNLGIEVLITQPYTVAHYFFDLTCDGSQASMISYGMTPGICQSTPGEARNPQLIVNGNEATYAAYSDASCTNLIKYSNFTATVGVCTVVENYSENFSVLITRNNSTSSSHSKHRDTSASTVSSSPHVRHLASRIRHHHQRTHTRHHIAAMSRRS